MCLEYSPTYEISLQIFIATPRWSRLYLVLSPRRAVTFEVLSLPEQFITEAATVIVIRHHLTASAPYSDNYEEDEEGKRPVCPVIKDMEDEIALDDVICQTVLPYGLAAQLLLDENPASASFYQQRYEELLKEVGKSRYGRSMAIEDIYGTAFEYTEFARWG